MELLDRVKLLLGVQNQDALLLELIEMTNQKLMSYLKVDILPIEFEWIVVELTIQRFNRIGSEGMSSESTDGGSNVYLDDELSPYYQYLDEFVSSNGTKKGYRLF